MTPEWGSSSWAHLQLHSCRNYVTVECDLKVLQQHPWYFSFYHPQCSSSFAHISHHFKLVPFLHRERKMLAYSGYDWLKWCSGTLLASFEPFLPKSEMVFFQKMRFCVQPLFRSYTLTYLEPTGQSPACQSSQVVPFLPLLKEKVRESQTSIESVEAKSLCLLKVLENGGKPILLNRCLENGWN